MEGDLISLSEARDQLRQTSTVDEQYVMRTITAASYIIRDYLKSRADRTVTIESSSVANPTVLTTDGTLHGYSTGDSVTLIDHVDSTPTLSGPYELTVVNSTSFTVPVNVTVAGTGGTAKVLWNEETAPFHVKHATLLMFTHLYEHRGDDMRLDGTLWEAIGRLLARSRDPAYA